MRTTMLDDYGINLQAKERATLSAIMDDVFTPTEKEVFQNFAYDEDMLELFMPMYTALKDAVRRCVLEGGDPHSLAEQLRGCRQADPANARESGVADQAATARLLSEQQQIVEEEAGRLLEHFQNTNVDRHIIPNNKLTNHMSSQVEKPGSFKLPVSAAVKRSTPMKVICSLAHEDENLKISGRRPFTEYDRNVYNALVSLYVCGDKSHIVTPQTVYRAMVGMSDTEDPSRQQIRAITESLDKMRFTRTVINCTDEIKHRQATLGRKFAGMGMIDTYLLNAMVVHVEAGGQTVRAYRINSTPVLYQYSILLNEVLTVPSALLDIKEVDQNGGVTDDRVSNTEGCIQIKGYLLRRIEGMKGKNRLKSKVISLDGYDKDGVHHKGLYEIAGLAGDASRKTQKSVRDYAEQVLGYRKAEGYINGYSFVTTKRTITGIQIDI